MKTAETLFSLTPDPLAAVQWYLANYRPPVAEMPIDKTRDAFIADRMPHVSDVALRDYLNQRRALPLACHAAIGGCFPAIWRSFLAGGDLPKQFATDRKGFDTAQTKLGRLHRVAGGR